MDGNEVFESSKGGIDKLCRNCKLHDVLCHTHGHHDLSNSSSRCSKRIGFILYSFNLLKLICSCGMTEFESITISDYRGLCIDLPHEANH